MYEYEDYEDVKMSKSVAEKTLQKAKAIEREKIASGDYEEVKIDEKTVILRKKKK